jgi:hypothetical protein
MKTIMLNALSFGKKTVIMLLAVMVTLKSATA